jgi:glycosyltransferase involved in cell wall biosynthesis
VYDEFVKEFPRYKDKFEILFPSVPLMVKEKKHKKDITLIFVGRYFYQKGGFHALLAMEQLVKKYSNVNAIIVSVIPEDIKKKYSKNKKIKMFDLMPQDKVFELYKKADISVYPGYSDSFGYAFLETMSFGIPTITIDGDSRRELIEDGKNGFVIERPGGFTLKETENPTSKLIDSLVDSASRLIEDKKLLRKMSKESISIISHGKFSMEERNKKLKRIYEEIIK